MVIQCEDGCYNDGVACMHTNGIDVFHTADGDGMVGTVTHNLEFDFLIALYALFYQNLMHRGKLQRMLHDFHQLCFVIGKAAACAAQCEGRTQHNGITDFICGCDGFFYGISNLRGDNGLTDGLAHFLEQLTILCAFDAIDGSPQKLNLTLLQDTLFFQLHCQIQTCLSADTGNDGIRSFVAQDFCNIFQSQWFHINLIRNGGICHDGCGVRID